MNLSKVLEYTVGQTYDYDARPQDKGSVFIVMKVEDSERLGQIVHGVIDGVVLKNPHVAGGIQDALYHVPMAIEGLEKSGLQFVKMVDVSRYESDFKSGYATWKEAFDAGTGGIFTIGLSEVVAFVEHIIKSGD